MSDESINRAENETSILPSTEDQKIPVITLPNLATHLINQKTNKTSSNLSCLSTSRPVAVTTRVPKSPATANTVSVKTCLTDNSHNSQTDKDINKCENPEYILESIDEWNMDCQELVKENKSIKAGLHLLLEERQNLLTENSKLTEDVDKFHESIKHSHVQLSRLSQLDDENQELKKTISDLKNHIDKQKQDHEKKMDDNKSKLEFLGESHREEIKNITDQLTASAEFEKKLLSDKIGKYEKDIVGLQMENNQLQTTKESQISQLTMEYENKLTNLQRQKLQQQQNQINQNNQEMFRKKLQHMKDEYEKEIKGLKRTIEDYQIGSRPSPRSRERLTLTTVGGKKRKS